MKREELFVASSMARVTAILFVGRAHGGGSATISAMRGQNMFIIQFENPLTEEGTREVNAKCFADDQ